MKHITRHFLFLPLLAATAGCTGNFEEYNTNPYEVSEEMMAQDNMKTGAFFAEMQRGVTLFADGTNLYSDYQVEEGLTSDLYSNYVAPISAWGRSGVHNGCYAFINGWYDQTFTKRYTQVMAPFIQLKKAADEQNLPEITALATIVKVMAMHRAADAYGALPYTTYGSGNLASVYDPLDKIYEKFFDELDSAIDELSNYANVNPSATIMKKYDYIYSGNVTQWIKLANTLRLRLAMRCAYANPTLAKQEAEKSASNSFGLIESTADRAVVGNGQYATISYYHPIYEIAYNFNGGEFRMNASMDSYMNGYNDPRLPKYFNAAGDGKYHGVRLGIIRSNFNSYQSDKTSNFNMSTNSKITWFTAAESYFLRAEGALRGWNMGGTAKDFYEKGVSMSFEENGASGASDYLADSTSKPADFVDNVGNASKAAMSDITIKWNDSDSFERNLERIITQKWIALFPDGPEGWAEFRRTAYPKLFPVLNNRSNNTVDTDIQVRRIPFPVDEYNNDAEGITTAIEALGGEDNGGTRVWWDKKQ